MVIEGQAKTQLEQVVDLLSTGSSKEKALDVYSRIPELLITQNHIEIYCHHITEKHKLWQFFEKSQNPIKIKNDDGEFVVFYRKNDYPLVIPNPRSVFKAAYKREPKLFKAYYKPRSDKDPWKGDSPFGIVHYILLFELVNRSYDLHRALMLYGSIIEILKLFGYSFGKYFTQGLDLNYYCFISQELLTSAGFVAKENISIFRNTDEGAGKILLEKENNLTEKIQGHDYQQYLDKLVDYIFNSDRYGGALNDHIPVTPHKPSFQGSHFKKVLTKENIEKLFTKKILAPNTPPYYYCEKEIFRKFIKDHMKKDTTDLTLAIQHQNIMQLIRQTLNSDHVFSV